jgi:hypothetical protein
VMVDARGAPEVESAMDDIEAAVLFEEAAPGLTRGHRPESEIEILCTARALLFIAHRHPHCST